MKAIRAGVFEIRKIPLICCACGCGDTLPSVDTRGIARRFIRGHHARKHGEHMTEPVVVHMRPSEYEELRQEAARRDIPKSRVLLELWRERRATNGERQVA